MRIYSEHNGVPWNYVRVRNHFALLPMVIQRPHRGILWLEFYGKVFEYYNGAWHFVGILHRDFNVALFKDIREKHIRVNWSYPSLTYRLWYFLRILLVGLFWVATILGLVLLVHKYM